MANRIKINNIILRTNVLELFFSDPASFSVLLFGESDMHLYYAILELTVKTYTFTTCKNKANSL